jgi:hypothetical protein
MNADTHASSSKVSAFICVYLGLLTAACAPEPAYTPFVPPSESDAGTPTTIPLPLPSPPSTPTAIPSAPAASNTTPIPCTDDLDFVQDLTIPDGSPMQPGVSIDKQWLVTNSGTCNWNSAYRFKLILGDALGANIEQALYPARTGTQATLRVVFVAPLEEGTYQSAWQAFAPDGSPFGDAVFMQIVVLP